MKRYCFDTSGISNPVETMPDDIFESLWLKVIAVIEAGEIAVTALPLADLMIDRESVRPRL